MFVILLLLIVPLRACYLLFCSSYFSSATTMKFPFIMQHNNIKLFLLVSLNLHIEKLNEILPCSTLYYINNFILLIRSDNLSFQFIQFIFEEFEENNIFFYLQTIFSNLRFNKMVYIFIFLVAKIGNYHNYCRISNLI